MCTPINDQLPGKLDFAGYTKNNILFLTWNVKCLKVSVANHPNNIMLAFNKTNFWNNGEIGIRYTTGEISGTPVYPVFTYDWYITVCFFPHSTISTLKSAWKYGSGIDSQFPVFTESLPLCFLFTKTSSITFYFGRMPDKSLLPYSFLLKIEFSGTFLFTL